METYLLDVNDPMEYRLTELHFREVLRRQKWEEGQCKKHETTRQDMAEIYQRMMKMDGRLKVTYCTLIWFLMRYCFSYNYLIVL